MTAKETFLKRITDQIKVLQDAYNHNKQLPDLFFEGLSTSAFVQPPPFNQKSNGVAEKEESEYGRNKKLIVQILNTAKKALLKSEIEQEFRKMLNVQTDETKTVTNALSSLTMDGAVRGHKPEDFKIRGNFWALSTWWEGNSLRPDYRPKAAEYGNKYLFE